MQPEEPIMPTAEPDDQIARLETAVAVMRGDGHYRLVATRAIAAGERLLVLRGQLTDTPTRYSVQIGPGEHLTPPAGQEVEETMDQQPWRFLNHSCRPNARIEGMELFAIEAMLPWEQITFDYNTTELLLATPFTCRCGAAECVGEVRGYVSLSERQRALRGERIASHLRSFAAEG